MLVAFSGGKDSTAMALHLAELGESFELVYTATGNELPDVEQHIARVVEATGAELIRVPAPTLVELIQEQQCLPNHRMRWCTRMIKIDPMQKWLTPGATLAVGLRADEEGRAGATYDAAEVVYPLRDWNWGLNEVLHCCERHNLTPPARTDCAWCYHQTLYEWWSLWYNHFELYLEGARWEQDIGYTFRSPGRDTQPASLADLATKFVMGYVPKPFKRKTSCRVCSL